MAYLTPPPDTRPLPLDPLIRHAEAALPGAVPSRIVLPRKPDAPLTIRLKYSEELHPNGLSAVSLDAYRGAVLKVDDIRRDSAADHLVNLRYPLHIERYGGLWSRLLYVVVCLAPAMLYVTGAVMAWNRWRSRRRRAGSKRPPRIRVKGTSRREMPEEEAPVSTLL